ncbi:FtsX-like permease family protein [Paenibacillus thermoaerophilus]|uniref:FtsX-like permease family protein n=1 Tax=Paenibacillus thermoaerophilus TaxID=1215385 RepID=A0ABW2V0A3_9BACL|nr:ABC transporter permease [Paenibacillus thermoaerophilus]TMV18167.1 ABC transporter permease [Paenibacillus thermoaerophilus]
MNLWQIAWRNLMRRKLRTFLTILSIVIGVGSAFAVIASIDTANKVFPLYLKSAFGKADYTMNGTEAYFSQEVYEQVRKLNNAASIAALKQNTKLHWEEEGITSIQKRVDLIGYSSLNTPLTNFKLIKGSLESGGAVITDRSARVWKIDVGDKLSFDTDNGIREIEVSAIVKYTVELMGPSSWMMAKYHPWSVAVPLPVLQEWFGKAGQIENVQIKALNEAEMRAVQNQVDELVKQYDNVYMQPVIIDFDSQFKDAGTFFLALYIAGFLGIALSAFIIFHSLYVSIKERKNEFASLKTIGYTPEQLRTFVLFEVHLLSVIGTGAGLAVGYGLAALLKAVIFLVFSVYDEGSMTVAKGLVVSVLAGILVPIAASFYPMYQAGKVSVIEGLKEQPAKPGRLRIWQPVAGTLLILSCFWIKHLLLIVPLFIGVALVFPYLFRMFAFLLRPVYRLLFGFSGEVAIRNLNRNSGRSAMTSVILCMGIAMILLMSSLNSAIIQTYEQVIHSSYGGNLDVEFHHIEKTDLEQLKKIEGVADAETYPLYSAVWTLNGQKRKLPVYGVGEEWIDRFPLFAVSGTTHSELIRQLDEQELILDQIAYGIWGGTIGETITLETLRGPRPFTVAGVVKTMKNSGYGAFMREDVFRDNFGLKYERNALVIKDENTTPLQLRERIFDQFGVRIMEMFGPEDWVSVIGAIYTGSFSIINLLVVLSIVISGIGIANTLLMNIMERIRELGMMRAVGVTRRQIIRMIVLEGFGIGVTATVIGLILGILLIYMASTFFSIQSLTYQFGVSWVILLAVGLFGLFISLMSSFTPARRAAKTRLSEALRYE